jgi:hypothetical protein
LGKFDIWRTFMMSGKKNFIIAFVILLVLFSGNTLFADTVTYPGAYSTGDLITALGINTRFETLYNVLDGEDIDNTNLSSDAASLEKVSAGVMISSGGEIGIGTASPVQIFQVGDGAGSNYALFYTNPGEAYRSGILLTNAANSDSGSTSLKFSSAYNGNGATTGTAKIGFVNNADKETFQNGGAQIVLQNGTGDVTLCESSGNVGIGTTSPTGKLHLWETDNTIPTVIAFDNSGSNRAAAIGIAESTGHIMSGNIAGALSFGSHTGPITFGTNSSGVAQYRMTISTSGNIGIGTTTPFGKLHVYGSGQELIKVESTGSNAWIYLESGHMEGLWAVGSKIDDGGLQFYNNDTTTLGMYIKPSGYVGIGINNPGYRLQVGESSNYGWVNANGSWGSSSDVRQKENVVEIDSGLNKLLKIRGVEYNTIGNDPENKQIGFIAQEMEEIIPEIVSTDANGYKGIAYAKLTPILVEAIKEQQRLIETQQLQIDKLINRIDTLENK